MDKKGKKSDFWMNNVWTRPFSVVLYTQEIRGETFLVKKETPARTQKTHELSN